MNLACRHKDEILYSNKDKVHLKSKEFPKLFVPVENNMQVRPNRK